MKSKEFAKLLEEGKSITGWYFVPTQFICAGFVPGTGGTLKVWGYYPYQIVGFGIKPAGKIQFLAKIINKLGTVYEHNDFLTTDKPVKYDWDRHLEFYETEAEAINECHLRNRGKMGPGPCHNFDLTSLKKDEKKFAADKFY